MKQSGKRNAAESEAPRAESEAPRAESEAPRAESEAPRLKWSLLFPTRAGRQGFCGHIHDPADPERRFVVELLLDGAPVALTRADRFDADLADQGGEGRHGFIFSIDAAVLQSARLAQIRLANGDLVLEPPLMLRAAAPTGGGRRAGGVRWLGGLRFSGWIDRTTAQSGSLSPRLRASIDGEIVAEIAEEQWTHVGEGRDAAAVAGFNLRLPEKFADGRAHFLQIHDENGRELPESPCFFATLADELARFVENRGEIESEKLRGEGFDLLIPPSLPFSGFAEWRQRFPAPALASEAGVMRKIGVALIGGQDVEASMASLEAQQGCEWTVAALPSGEGEAAFSNAALGDFLGNQAADCQTLVFTRAGAVLQPQALALLHRALTLFPAAPAAYCDFTICAEDGGEWPVALTAFDYERMLEQGFAAGIFALRRSFAQAAALGGADNLYRLFNFSQDSFRAAGSPRTGLPMARAPVHAPGFLARLPVENLAQAARTLARANEAHFAARGVCARIEPGFGALFPTVHVRRSDLQTKVSILIPARDRVDMLKPCLEGLFATVDLARHEVIVLDNDSSDPATQNCFDEAARRGVRIERVGGPFESPEIVNKGAAIASHQFLLLLENGVEALHPGWLEEMLGRMVEPDVGAVGAMLSWPNGVVRQGGVVLGPGLDAVPAFSGRIDGDPGYGDLLRAAHEVSALKAACLLTDRRLFCDVGGFDGLHFPVHYADVDYSLKLRARGLRLVLTPRAKLLHRSTDGLDRDPRPDRAERQKTELRLLRSAWGEVLVADPCYNPLLSLDRRPFTGLAWPPRPGEPRQPGSPAPRPLPPYF